MQDQHAQARRDGPKGVKKQEMAHRHDEEDDDKFLRANDFSAPAQPAGSRLVRCCPESPTWASHSGRVHHTHHLPTMAHPHPSTLTPPELAHLAEQVPIRILPRHRLDPIPLLAGATPALRPPHPASLPLYLALLLAAQQRADILPPPWLAVPALQAVLDDELAGAARDAPHAAQLTPPAGADPSDPRLPFFYLEIATMLLAAPAAAASIPDAEGVRRLLRDIREIRAAKIRSTLHGVDGHAGVDVSGIGAMEVAEQRAFVQGVVDGMRKLGKSREEAAREAAMEGGDVGEEDDDMDLV